MRRSLCEAAILQRTVDALRDVDVDDDANEDVAGIADDVDYDARPGTEGVGY